MTIGEMTSGIFEWELSRTSKTHDQIISEVFAMSDAEIEERYSDIKERKYIG